MIISDPCTRYGINAGCDSDCPVFQSGQCEIGDKNILDNFSLDSDEHYYYMDLYGLLPERQLIPIFEV